MMSEKKKELTRGVRHILGLVLRDRDSDGWASTGKAIHKHLKKNLSSDLAIVEKTESGGRVKLTEEGELVLGVINKWAL